MHNEYVVTLPNGVGILSLCHKKGLAATVYMCNTVHAHTHTHTRTVQQGQLQSITDYNKKFYILLVTSFCVQAICVDSFEGGILCDYECK